MLYRRALCYQFSPNCEFEDTLSKMRYGVSRITDAVKIFDSSEKIVGGLGLGQLAK